MKPKKEEFPARSAYKRYTAQFKEQALERAGRDGIPAVSKDLGLAEATLVCDALIMALYPQAQVASKDANRRNRPLWPGQPILFSCLPEAVQKTSADLQHEQEGRLL